MRGSKKIYIVLVLTLLNGVSFNNLSYQALPLSPTNAQADTKEKHSIYRGWDYLALKLIADGISKQEVDAIYKNKRIPVFQTVSFALAPKESSHSYRHFLKSDRLAKAQAFLNKHKDSLTHTEQRFAVSRYVIAALLLVETHYGTHTGRSMILNRLSRIANISDEENLKYNVKQLLKKHPNTTEEAIRARAFYLEETFYPEILALFHIAEQNNTNIFNILGSHAGAFGIPQFLPSNYIKFGVDGNGDGIVSLFTMEDAIASTANFLASYGWKDKAMNDEKRQVIWRYNRSEAYVDTILAVANQLKKQDGNAISKVEKASPKPIFEFDD